MPNKPAPIFCRSRAWIELDRDALRHNVQVLQKLLPNDCELMPAVKANAYGHGAVLISRELNRLGIKAFCVATVSEGIELRENGIVGEILILGYTYPMQFPLLKQYDLTQTVIDLPYAEILNKYGQKVKVHIAIDTGMHRLGEPCRNIENICKMFNLHNLEIEGIYTHLCADDTNLPQDRAFTMEQSRAFYSTISQLRERGFECPKEHLLASYGLINYSELGGNYARIGIALYGVLSTRADRERCSISLRPVLSVKTRITTLNTLQKGESAGYGLQFVADRDTKIAVLAIGYADGIPRSLSCSVGNVLIKGIKVPIIGRICMDQMLIDVSNIPNVKAGDVAVIIGQSGDQKITACDLAEQTGTISNEILSRLGERLERQMI